MKKVILASASPRRRELLRYILEDFDICVSRCDETCDIKDPALFVAELAKRKAEDVAGMHPHSIVIGSDTVVFASGRILGKPKDSDEARSFIGLLSGKTHSVYTGVHIASGERALSCTARTDVSFVPMTDDEISEYIGTFDWKDKAGAYGIQSAAAKYVSGISGCYYNVMGFPVSLVYRMLKSF